MSKLEIIAGISKDAVKLEDINEEQLEVLCHVLEAIRRSGICNMWGAAEPLRIGTGISIELSEAVLLYWIRHYDELNKKYDWQ